MLSLSQPIKVAVLQTLYNSCAETKTVEGETCYRIDQIAPFITQSGTIEDAVDVCEAFGINYYYMDL